MVSKLRIIWNQAEVRAVKNEEGLSQLRSLLAEQKTRADHLAEGKRRAKAQAAREHEQLLDESLQLGSLLEDEQRCVEQVSHEALLANESAAAARAALQDEARQLESLLFQVRFHIIRNARIAIVCKSQSCMVSKLRIMLFQERTRAEELGAGKRRATARALRVRVQLIGHARNNM